MQISATAAQPQVDTGNLPKMLIHTFYTVFQRLCGAFGLTPKEVALGIAALVLIGLATQIYGAIKNKTSFTLDEKAP